MGMGWAGITVTQLKRMLPDPLEKVERGHAPFVARTANDGCGCCPCCREFVYVEFDQPGHLACCPSCGGLVSALEPFGESSV